MRLPLFQAEESVEKIQKRRLDGSGRGTASEQVRVDGTERVLIQVGRIKWGLQL